MQDTDPINVIYKIQRHLDNSIDDCAQTLMSGGVDNMSKYSYICGKIHAMDKIKQELSNLLNPKEPDDDEEDGKITSIRS
tara:strand:- start:1327 stop:1566 length:240 start_codon:yes stop_codon:yes gene_type:complete